MSPSARTTTPCTAPDGLALGPFTDAVFGGIGQSEILLTRAVGGSIAFEHYWAPSLRTAFVFGYLNISYSDAAKAEIANLGQRCALGGTAATAFNIQPVDGGGARAIAIRTGRPGGWRRARSGIRSPISMSVWRSAIPGSTPHSRAWEASLQRASNPNGTSLSAGNYSIQDQGVWTATMRVQRSF